MSQTISVPVVGSPMTDVALTSSSGKSSSLRAEIDGTPALVFFMRASTCPVCLAHARAILKMVDGGALIGHRFVVIAPRGAEDAARVVSSLKSPLASVWASGSGHSDVGLGRFLSIQHSGTFLVGADGIVRHARTGVLPTQSFSAREVIAALEG